MESTTMIRRFVLIAIASSILFTTATLLAKPAAKDVGQSSRGVNVTQQARMESSATLIGKDGKPRPVKAALRRWVIPGKQRAELDERGFLIIQLRGGKVNVTMDGKEQKHVPGDFWVVPANSKMSIQVMTETAGLDVLSLDLK